jgi:hypothetical protein
MKIIIATMVAITITVMTAPITAQAPISQGDIPGDLCPNMGPHQLPTKELSENPTRQELITKLYEIATKKGIQAGIVTQIQNTIECESRWNPGAIGDNGTSIGLVQIHMPAHPNISPIQAFDPIFSLEFITDGFRAGKTAQWTCWKCIYGDDAVQCPLTQIIVQKDA